MNRTRNITRKQGVFFPGSFTRHQTVDRTFHGIRVIICFIFLLVSSRSSAQNTPGFYLLPDLDPTSIEPQERKMIDSVLTLYQTAKDTTRLQLLDVLSSSCSDELWPLYNQYAYEYALKLLKDSLSYTERELFLIVGAKANARVNQGVFLSRKGQYAEALPLYEEGLRDFRSVNDKLGESNTLTNIAVLFAQQGKFQKAYDLHQQNLPLLKEAGNDRALVYNLNSMAVISRNLGKLDQSLRLFYECLRLEEKNGHTAPLGAIYLNLGALHVQLHSPEDAIKNFQKCEKIARELNLKNVTVRALHNMAGVYRDQGEYSKAGELYNQCLSINRSLGDSSAVALTYLNMALNFRKTGEMRQAERLHLLSVRLLEKTQDKSRLVNALYNLATFYVREGKYQAALPVAKRSLDLAEERGLTENVQQAAEALKDIHKKTGNWKEAYLMSELAAKMRDSIHNSANTKALFKYNLEYEYQKEKLADSLNFAKQREISELTISRQEAQIRQEKYQRNGLFVILFLVATLTIVLYRNNKAKVKANLLITQQKKQVEEKNAENELLLSEIHHRVKNNLQVISSLLSLQERNLEDSTAKSALHEGKERIKSMELVHKLLYQRGSFTGIGMQDYIQLLADGLLESFGKIKDETELEIIVENLTLDVDTAIPLGLILNELIVNALKHAKTRQGRLKLAVKLYEKDGRLILEVKDNGKGRKEDIQSMDSFGMKIVKALLKQLKGEMQIIEDKGLLFQLSLENYKLTLHGN